MSADNGSTENTYEYDANGNRNGGSNDVGSGNRLAADATWSYSYDNEGNLIKRVNITEGEDAGITWTYAYDNANHLIQAKLWDSDPDEHEEAVLQRQADYVYDVFGNRIEKIVDWDGEGEDDPVVSKFAYDGWNNVKSSSPVGNENWDVIVDLDDAGSLTTRYMRGDALDQLFASVANDGDTLWNLTDHLGSVRDVIDNTGAVKDEITYDAFGNFTESDPEFGGRYKYTSREFDAETGFQFNRARYYDAETGRWISQDPLGFDAGDSNLYRYVNNRPTMEVDPSGLEPPHYDNYSEKVNALLEIGPLRAYRANALATLALNTTQEQFPKAALHNDNADAWRHAFWSAMMAKDAKLTPTSNLVGAVGKFSVFRQVDYPYRVGLLHEFYGAKADPPQPGMEAIMDLHNNNVGLQIGRELGPKASVGAVMKAVYKALNSDQLIWIEGKGVNSRFTGTARFSLPTGVFKKTPFGALSFFETPLYQEIVYPQNVIGPFAWQSGAPAEIINQLERLRIIGGGFFPNN